MNTFDEKRRQFEKRLDAIAQRQTGEVPQPGTDDDTSATPRAGLSTSFEERLRDYEARLNAQIEAHHRQRMEDGEWRMEDGRGKMESPVHPPSSTFHFPSSIFPLPRIELTGAPALQALDHLFAAEFELARYFPGRSLERYPTIYAETLEEFYAPYLELLDVSERSKAAILTRLKAQAEEGATLGGGGTFGIFWPGRGCYLNGWLFARTAVSGTGKPPPTPRELLTDPEVLPCILATAVHEKQGHGFVSEFTALGEEKRRLGTWRYDIARRFDLREVDTPTGALLEEKEAVVYGSSQLLEEGWATWIEHHTMGHWTALSGGSWSGAPYSLTQVGELLRHLEEESPNKVGREVVQQVCEALRVLFLAPEPGSEDLHAAVLALHAHGSGLNDAFIQTFGQPFAYAVGYLLLRKLEGRLGTLCLPYAVAIAANVTYGLERVAAGDLQRLVARDPRLNVDSRLAHLGLLELTQKGDVAELTRRAHEELNLAVPAGMTADR